MIFATAIAYFFLVAAVVVLVAFPGYRTRLASALRLSIHQGSQPLFRISRGLLLGTRLLQGATGQYLRGVVGFVRAERSWLMGASLLLIGPSLIVLGVGSKGIFDFSGGEERASRQISVLLMGEQLVPPPALPPEAFTTREVELVRPDAAYASRDWELLDGEFMQRLLLIFKLMKERHGYEMVLIEGYRSPERQAQLFSQGGHVTQAPANMSYHQYGLAADAAFMRQGRIVISERDPWVMEAYARYGEIAEEIGLVWGGRWKMRDYGHVELQRKGVLQGGNR